MSKDMKDAERGEKGSFFLLCAEKAGGASWQEGSEKVEKRMRLLSSQSASHRHCHGRTSQSVHICPKLSSGA